MGARGRGGYCFEHKMLLKAALEEMGLGHVDLMWLSCALGAPVMIAHSTTSCCA